MAASQTPVRGGPHELRCQETVSLDPDSEAAEMWRREGAAHSLPEQGMVGARLPGMGKGPPPGLVTGAPFAALLFVMGPEQRGTDGGWLSEDKGLR